MHKGVDQYIAKHSDRISELEVLREIMLSLPMEEEVKWGAPVYTVNGKNVVGLGSFKAYVGIWFFQGVFLADLDRVLVNAQEGKTKAMRQWRFSSIEEIDVQLVKSYVLEAIANQKQGKELKPVKSKSKLIVSELETALSADPVLKACFTKFSPYKQKEFAEYIETAKRVETKRSRIDKIKPMIFKGIGLNDKYR